MYKIVTFPGQDEQGNVFVQALFPSGDLVKVASFDQLSQDVMDFIAKLKPTQEYCYVLVNAMGAGEYYSSNINGDWFSEADLNPSEPDADWGYKTFANAGIYRHHKNKDKTKSMGTVIFCYYNTVMHRVELILQIDKKKATELGHGDLVAVLESGAHPAVSMGTRVKFDVCNICGNKSATKDDYCICAKTMMNQILPDGRKVCVKNPRPRMFDLSFVLIGADRASFSMMKIASIEGAVLSADAAYEEGLLDDPIDLFSEKTAAQSKLSEITKRIPAFSAVTVKNVIANETPIEPHILDRVGALGLNSCLDAFTNRGIVLSPPEFRRVVIISSGANPSAFSEEQPIFDDEEPRRAWRYGGTNEKSIASLLGSLTQRRSIFEPFISNRILTITVIPSNTIKEASEKTAIDDEASRLISALYLGYRQELFEKLSCASKTIPVEFLPEEVHDASLESALGTVRKVASPQALLGAIPLAFLYSAYMDRSKKGEDAMVGMVKDNPILATSILSGLLRIGLALDKAGVLDIAARKLLV